MRWPVRSCRRAAPGGRQRNFVAGMEDVLELYQRSRDPPRPIVCLDETSKQLMTKTRMPIAAKLFMMFAPWEGGAMSRSPTAEAASIG